MSQSIILDVHNLTVMRTQDFCLHIKRLRVKKGTILCIAGPNGSGKTTFMECLSGLLRPSRGSIRMQGKLIDNNIYRTKSLVGVIPDDEDWFIKELCAREYLELLLTIHQLAGASLDIMRKRIENMANQLHFTSFEEPLEFLSHGNKKKVQIIAGLMHMPPVIIVDEIRNGLDPLAIIAVERILRQETKHGSIVVAATHDLWWAERIADETVLLIGGKPWIHERTNVLVKQYGSIEALFIRAVTGESSV